MSEERKSKKAWSADPSSGVRLVTVYEWPPNDNVWWCPELGYSTSGPPHDFFDDEQSALKKAISDLELQIAGRKQMLDQLIARKKGNRAKK